MNKFSIRPAEIGDISDITFLCDELGYPSAEDQVSERLLSLLKSHNDSVLVSLDVEGNITGWIHVFIALRLESDSFAEIGGLVVKSTTRGKGYGKMLVAAAEQWAEKNGVTKIRVRSRIERKDTKLFYEREGYKIKKEQNVFEKKLICS